MNKFFTSPLLVVRATIFAMALMLATTTAQAQTAGQLDTSFNPGNGASSKVWSIALQPDGKVMIGGDFNDFNGTARNRIARLNADGSIDPSFNPGTGANNSIYTIILQPDGKIIIGGGFSNYNGTAISHIARLNTDGSIDPTFNPAGSGVNMGVFTALRQPDGKIIIGGQFYGGVARLNADGSLDTSFNPGTGATSNRVMTIALQPDGKVIIGGTFEYYNGTARSRIARLNSDGSLDAAFNPGTGAGDVLFPRVASAVVQSDGKIIIGGEFSTFNGTARNSIARLNADGSLDATFNPNNGANNWINSVVLQPNGKLIIGGGFTNYNGTTRNRIARLNANGSLDATFNPGNGVDEELLTAVLQPDGAVIIGGLFYTYNGTFRSHIARVMGGELVAAPDLVSTQIRLFPNPATGRITLDLSGITETRTAPVEVQNMLGQTVLRSTILTGTVEEVNLQDFPEGSYLVRVILSEQVLTQRIVLQR